MKISVKTKLMVAGIVILIISGGTGIFVWHSHQSKMESSKISVSQVAQNISQQESIKSTVAGNINDVTAGKLANQEMEKSNNNETNNIKNNEFSSPTVKAPVGSNLQTEKPEETLVEKYDKIVNSPEYITDRDKEGGPFVSESGYYTQQAEKLKQEKVQLENKLAKASKDEQDQIQKELEEVKSKYKEAKVNMFQNLILTMDAYDRITLKHFTVEELGAVFRRKGYQISYGSPLPGVGKEDIEFVSEAKKRLAEKEFVPNPWTAILLSW